MKVTEEQQFDGFLSPAVTKPLHGVRKTSYVATIPAFGASVANMDGVADRTHVGLGEGYGSPAADSFPDPGSTSKTEIECDRSLAT